MNTYSKILRIKPCDTLFFGNGRRFNRSESAWINSRLMPYPSVFYGAICGLMLAHHPKKCESYLTKNNNKYDPRTSLMIGNVYLYNEETGQTYMKAPLDLCIVEKGNLEYIKIEKLPQNVVTSSKISYIFSSEKAVEEKFDDMYISVISFHNTYSILGKEIEYISASDMTVPSYKVGIQRNHNYAAKEGCLYRIDVTEFVNGNWSYLVEYDNSSWWDSSYSEPKQGYLKLGGENKACQYYVEDKADYVDDVSIEEICETGYVKMIITSPYLDMDTLSWAFDSDDLSNQIKIYAGQIGKLEHVGGYDMKLKRNKCMHQALPQGSVLVIGSKLFVKKSLRSIREIIEKQLISNSNNNDNVNEYRAGFNQFQIVSLIGEQLKQG